MMRESFATHISNPFHVVAVAKIYVYYVSLQVSKIDLMHVKIRDVI